MSDKAQLHTIAFDGLAFLTGDFATDTFLPPGKVSDYFGFQYMRDIDAGEKGHNTSFLRARAFGIVIRSLDETQRAALAALTFADSRTWPNLADQLDRRGMPHDVNVAMMTYASEFFSWHAGSLEADTYLCPERHGMYFGGFGMKTAPAMGKRDYSISTALTGDAGEAFLQALTAAQRPAIPDVVDLQRADLAEIA